MDNIFWTLTTVLFLAASIKAIEMCEDIMKPPNNDTGLVSCAYNVSSSVANTSFPLFFNWTTPFPPSSVPRRCHCGLMVMNLITDNGDDFSSLCNATADVYCTNYCYTNTNGQCNANSCATSHESVDLCAVYRTEEREYQVLVIYGLSCNTLVTHSQLVCDSLRNDDDNNDSPNDPLIISFAVGVSSVCFLILLAASIAIYCLYKRYRKWKTKNLYNFHHDNSTQGQIAIGQYRNPHLALYHNSDYDHLEKKNSLILEEQLEIYKKQFGRVLCKSSNITFKEEIGEGAYGKVYKGILHEECNGDISETTVAIKSIASVYPTSEQIEEFISESAIMLDFDHPNVLRLLGVCFDTEDQLPVIILPYMANGDLKSFLISKRGDNEPSILPDSLHIEDLLVMCISIAKGMEYLAKLKFVHRDLAARNCMIDENLIVKVADFGFSRDIYSRDYYRLERKVKLPVRWLPPESIYDGVYNEKTDVWSFGVVCWEIFNLGRIPYAGLDNVDIPEYISAGNRLTQTALCPQEMYSFSLMNLCWNYKPGERPSFSSLVLELKALYNDGTLTSSTTDKSSKDRTYFILEISV